MRPEPTLDPEDFEAMRQLGHRMVDEMIAHVRSVRERPVWRSPRDSALSRQPLAIPQDGQGAHATYEEFLKHVLPYELGNTHPRFWGWVLGAGTIDGALAAFLAAAMNSSASGLDSAVTRLERHVIDWFLDLFEWPRSSSGLITSSGSMSNFIGIVAARDRGSQRPTGLQALRSPLVFYCSDQTHNSVAKAVIAGGIGAEFLRTIPTTSDSRIDLGALARCISRDRTAGLSPHCVIGNVGTVNTGAIDDIAGLELIAREESLWLHIDGAFGALAWLDSRYRDSLEAIRRADSLAFDCHKWMHVPYDAALVLVREPAAHRAPFTPPAGPYLEPLPRGLNMLTEELGFHNLSLDLSRPARALKIWFGLKTHGIRGYAAQVTKNIDQARYLARRIAETTELELLETPPMNIVCFRHRAGGADADSADAFNRELLMRLQESGVAVPSGTTIRGRFCLRVALTNHRTSYEDLELLISACRDIGRPALRVS